MNTEPHNVLEIAQREVELITLAIHTVEECADEDKKLYHKKHRDKFYTEALDRLEVKATGARAYLFRIQTIVR